MESFDTINIPQFDPEAHNDRIQARILDSLQFRLQQQINLKNDEISRLQRDLAMLNGEIETLSDTVKTKQKSTKSSSKDLNKQIAQAKNEAELKLLQCKKEHSKKLQVIEQQHQTEIQSLQSTLEETIFQNTNSKTKKSKSSFRTEEFIEENDSNVNEEKDEVDNFLESLQTTKSIAKEKIQEIQKTKNVLTEADLKINDEKLAQKNELIKQLDERKKKLVNKIEQTKQSISQIEKSIDFEINSGTNPIEDPDNFSVDDLFNGSYANDPESLQLHEKTQPYIEKVQKAMKKMDEFKKKQQTSLNKLKKKIQLEQENIQSKQQQISEKERENDLLQQKIAKIKQKRIEEERKNKEREREMQAKEMAYRANSKLLQYLASLTSQQKEAKLQSLIIENKALKREIYRLDNMIYGKVGKYHEWKDI